MEPNLVSVLGPGLRMRVIRCEVAEVGVEGEVVMAKVEDMSGSVHWSLWR